jgi:TolB protein
MKNKLWILFYLPFFLFSKPIDEEILIPLARTEALSPIYISCPSPELKEPLVFDLDHNGITVAISGKVEEENQLLEKTPFAPVFWKSKAYSYVLKVSINEKTISATCFSLKTGELLEIGPFHLTGSHASDRRIMHQIADKIHELIEGKPGIAGTQIFYALQIPDGNKWKSEIWTADYDGKNNRQLTKEQSYCITPALFPRKGAFTDNRYLYVNYKLGQSKIYISTFDKPQGTPFVSLRGNQLLPTFSPDGTLIAFISDARGQADLFVQSFDPHKGLLGKPLQLYSFPDSVQASPTFHPNGKKMAFVSDQEGSPRIFLIHIPPFHSWKRPRPICLTKKYRENTCPSWSPDGTKLAYSAKIEGTRQIMVYDFTTHREVQLTTGMMHKENPCWAPDSTHIIFNTVHPSSSELFLINLKQKKMVQITEGPGKKHYPVWRAFY